MSEDATDPTRVAADSERPAATPAQEQRARDEAKRPVESQSAPHRDAHAQAAALAHRTALETEREVLNAMKQAQGPSNADTAARIERLEQRIAARETKLAELEGQIP